MLCPIHSLEQTVTVVKKVGTRSYIAPEVRLHCPPSWLSASSATTFNMPCFILTFKGPPTRAQRGLRSLFLRCHSWRGQKRPSHKLHAAPFLIAQLRPTTDCPSSQALLGKCLDWETVAPAVQELPKGTLDSEQERLLLGLLQRNPFERPSAAALLRSPFFAGRPRRRECCICFDNFELHEGLECPGVAPHFTCNSCFARHVGAKAEEELRLQERREGKVHCPLCEAAFSDAAVASSVRTQLFSQYVAARTKLAEVQTLPLPHSHTPTLKRHTHVPFTPSDSPTR